MPHRSRTVSQKHKTMNDDQKKRKEEQKTVPREDFLRLAADFENFKKEQNTFREEMVRFASLNVVTKMLDVLDLIDQAMDQAPKAVTEQKDWYEGLEGVRKAFLDTLAKAGAERIETEDKAFDPATMEAVGTAPGGESNTVQSQQRAGWTMHGRVIRPARVIVFQ